MFSWLNIPISISISFIRAVTRKDCCRFQTPGLSDNLPILPSSPPRLISYHQNLSRRQQHYQTDMAFAAARLLKDKQQKEQQLDNKKVIQN